MKVLHLLILVLLFTASAETASAGVLTEDGTPVCAFWTRADAVFRGKAVKVENAPKNEGFPEGARKIRFQVEQNYKGADNPTFTVVSTPDAALAVKSGQSWIIYAANDIVVKSFTVFRGVRLEPKIVSEETGALQNILDGKTDSAISGRIAPAVRGVLIAIEGGGKRLTGATDDAGSFYIPVPEGNYQVELKFPFRAALRWDENLLLGAKFTEGTPTLFRYDVKLNDGDCHFGAFEASKL